MIGRLEWRGDAVSEQRNIRDDDLAVKKIIALIRKTRRVKLPDAIILASAKVNDCSLLTADARLTKLGKIADVCSFKPLGTDQ